MSQNFVAVDVETTGVYNSDRVVEVATVTFRPDGEIIDEWDTLVNPCRDVGPTHIHRITASMVTAAPTFSEIAAVLADRIDGGILVAHNLPFDSRMIGNEFSRLGAAFDAGRGVCTLQATHQKLAEATSLHDIPHENAHRALADARATAHLLTALDENYATRDLHPATVECLSPDFHPRTLRRDMVVPHDLPMPPIARIITRTQRGDARGAELVYMDLLDHAISDLILTDTERSELRLLASELGLSPATVAAVQHRYFDDLVEASLRDGTIDPHEAEVISRVGKELGVSSDHVDTVVASQCRSTETFDIRPGTRICFTGTAVGTDGQALSRHDLEENAHQRNTIPVRNVTKSGCDLLVAADPSSQSGKTKQARKYGIPVTSVVDFLSVDPTVTVVFH